MKFTLSKSPTFNLRKISRGKILSALRWTTKYLIGLLFLGVAFWLGYVWYVSLYDYTWTEDQKNQYRSEYAGETSFREERFNHTLDVLRERIRLHQVLPSVQKDIFTGNTFQESGE